MLRAIILTLLCVAAPARAEDAPDCAARTEVRGGIKILRVSGTFEERGFLQGYCLYDGIIEMVDDYALASLPVLLFNLMKAGLRSRMVLPEGLRDEARGVIRGLRARGGGDVMSYRLGRGLDVDDILLVNAYVDYMASGCSSLSAWGRATREGALKGAPALARNLDWSSHPVLLQHQLVIVHRPTEADREPFLSVTFPGLLGCLSCVDAGGTGAFLNLGYGPNRGRLLEARRFQPVTMTLRDGVERRDPNGDGLGTIRDVSGILEEAPTVGSYGIHLLAKTTSGDAAPALVVELNAAGHALRTGSRSARFGEDSLGLTNHLQILDEPVGCRRYRDLAKRSRARDLDGPALWAAMGSVILGSATIQTMLYLPVAGSLRLWLRREAGDEPPRWEDGVVLDLNRIFAPGGTP